MSTAFKDYITDIYFPHIENKKVKQCSKFTLPWQQHHQTILNTLETPFCKANLLMTENPIGLFTIQHLVDTYKNKNQYCGTNLTLPWQQNIFLVLVCANQILIILYL